MIPRSTQGASAPADAQTARSASAGVENDATQQRDLSSDAPSSAPDAAPSGVPLAPPHGGELMMMTVFLRHDQSNNLDAFQSRLKAADWWERFPPAGVRVVSWTVAMGFGQIVTLELPPSLLGAVNVELERSAWGVFRTECYPTYDFVPVHARIRQRVRDGGQ